MFKPKQTLVHPQRFTAGGVSPGRGGNLGKPLPQVSGGEARAWGSQARSLSLSFLAWSVPSMDPLSVRARTVCCNHLVYSRHFIDEKQRPGNKMDLFPRLIWGWVGGPCLWPFSWNQNWHYVACGPDPAQRHFLLFLFLLFCWVLAMKVHIIEINFKHPYFYFLSNKS